MEIKTLFLSGLESLLNDVLDESISKKFFPIRVEISWNHEEKIFIVEEIEGETIPICSSCKSVRNEGQWEPVENYLLRKNIQCSHGICPPCAKKLYPDIYKKLHPDE